MSSLSHSDGNRREPAPLSPQGEGRGVKEPMAPGTLVGTISGLLLPLMLGLMTSTWVTTLFAVLTKHIGGGEALVVPLVVPLLWWLGGWFITRWSLRRPWAERRGGQVVAAIGLIAVLAGLWAVYFRLSYALWDARWLGALWGIGDAKGTPTLAILLLAAAGVLLWWNGILAGREATVSYDRLYRAFGIGVVAWAIMLALAGSNVARNDPGGKLLLFFLAGLSGLALAGLESVRQAAYERSGAQLAFNRFWLAAVASVILTILALGMLLSSLLAPETMARLLGVFSPVVNRLAQVLYLLITALTYIVFLILTPLIAFLRPRSPSALPPTPQPDPLESFRREMERAAQNQVGLPAWLVILAQALLIIAILAAVLLLLSRAFRRLRALDAEGVEESRETIGSWSLFWAQLAELLRHVWRRLRPVRRLATLDPFVPLVVTPGEEGRLSVREAYRRLLALARAYGYPRTRPQTPYEYQATLKRAFPEAPGEIETMTEAYVVARYGPVSPSETVISRVNQAWQAIWGRVKGK